jgi:hypothetical protein
LLSPDSTRLADEIRWSSLRADIVWVTADVELGSPSDDATSACVCPHGESFRIFPASFSVHSVQGFAVCAVAVTAINKIAENMKTARFIVRPDLPARTHANFITATAL